MTNPSNRIWAYLHDEMDAEEKDRFRQALEENADLRENMKLCKTTHRFLETLLPEIAGDDLNEEPSDQLVDHLIAEWDEAHPEPVKQEETPRKKPGGRILRFTAPLAAAAALVVMLALPLQTGPVLWQRTAYGTAPQLRGESGVSAHYSRADLKELNRALRQTVEAACLDLDEAPEKWVLQISLQELAGGALAVELSGHPRANPDASEHWNRNFPDSETFRAELPVLGQQVAEDISGSAD